MTDIPAALVEKAAAALRDEFAWPPGIRHDVLARAVIAAVWPDVRAEVNREQPDLMRQGYENGVGAMRTALAQVEAELVDARTARPVVDRAALADADLRALPMGAVVVTSGGLAWQKLDGDDWGRAQNQHQSKIRDSTWLANVKPRLIFDPDAPAADAADVRRQAAEDIAAAIEAYAMEPEQTPGFDMESALFSTMRAHEHAARLAREVGGDRG